MTINPALEPLPEKSIARIAGVIYILLAVCGAASFLVIRPAIVDPGNAEQTLANMVESGALARFGLVFELGVVMAQAVLAMIFFALFRPINRNGATALLVFGMVNATMILVSAMVNATALVVSRDADLAPGGDVAATVQLLSTVSEQTWSVGAVFFGLWLIPMGWIAATSGRMPVWLGRILMLGGVGYIAGAIVDAGMVDASTALIDGLAIPASIGEFWMMFYLLTIGIRPVVANSEGVDQGIRSG